MNKQHNGDLVSPARLLYNTYLKKIIKETTSKDVLNFDFSCTEEPVKK